MLPCKQNSPSKLTWWWKLRGRRFPPWRSACRWSHRSGVSLRKSFPQERGTFHQPQLLPLETPSPSQCRQPEEEQVVTINCGARRCFRLSTVLCTSHLFDFALDFKSRCPKKHINSTRDCWFLTHRLFPDEGKRHVSHKHTNRSLTRAPIPDAHCCIPRIHLVHGPLVDQWSLVAALSEPITDSDALDCFLIRRHEFVVNSLLNQNSVCAHACLSKIKAPILFVTLCSCQSNAETSLWISFGSIHWQLETLEAIYTRRDVDTTCWREPRQKCALSWRVPHLLSSPVRNRGTCRSSRPARRAPRWPSRTR